MFKKLTICAVAVLLSAPALAQKTYTPAQLRSMVQKGNYPKQGAVDTKTLAMDYASCVEHITSLVESVQPNYPTRTIVSTNILKVEKMWTNDAAVTLSCSALDKKMVMTSAPYQ